MNISCFSKYLQHYEGLDRLWYKTTDETCLYFKKGEIHHQTARVAEKNLDCDTENSK